MAFQRITNLYHKITGNAEQPSQKFQTLSNMDQQTPTTIISHSYNLTIFLPVATTWSQSASGTSNPPSFPSTPIRTIGQGACLSRISAAIFQQQRRPTRMQNVPIGDVIHLATMASCSNLLPIRCLESGSTIPHGKNQTIMFFPQCH